LMVHEESTRQLIEQNLQSLRRQLADAGIQVALLMVARGNTGERHSRPQRQPPEVESHAIPLSRVAKADPGPTADLPYRADRIDVLV